MSHHSLKSGYQQLVERLNRFPQGAPPSGLLYKILSILVNETEARHIATLPIKPFTVDEASQIWKMSELEAQKILDKLASRAMLVDMDNNGRSMYALPPPMAGFFEFSLMRLRDDVDQKILSELFYQYITREEDFIIDLFVKGETQLGRTFVHEPVLTNDNATYVLDYERASEVINTASHIGVGLCYCRHKMRHIGKACDAPMDICMTFNTTARSLIKHDFARSIDSVEGMELLHKAYDHNLVQFGENVRENVNFICNCCACCCEAMITQRRFGNLNPVHTTNFIPKLNLEECNGCGKCVDICPVEAMTLTSAHDPLKPRKKTAKLDNDICLGCGLCVKACPSAGISLSPREERVITPLNGTHKAVLMAIERGKLQNLIFDNQVLWNHRAMAAVLGVILKLPPIKQIMASQQVKSRYLETLISKYKN